MESVKSTLTKSIEEFIEKYPIFSLKTTENYFIVSGIYHFVGENNGITLEDYFALRIVINGVDCDLPPSVFEDKRIRNFHHKYSDNSLCLEVPTQISSFWKKNKYNLCLYFENYIDPYLYGFLYFEIMGSMPFGERSHGKKGHLEYFAEIFDIISLSQVEPFLVYLSENKCYRGHHVCPCGSLKKIRDCHKTTIYNYFTDTEKNQWVKSEIDTFLEATNGKKKH